MMTRAILEKTLGRTLSLKRHEAFCLLLRGLDKKTMARVMDVTPDMIQNHRCAIYVRLGVRSHAELLAKALDLVLTAAKETP